MVRHKSLLLISLALMGILATWGCRTEGKREPNGQLIAISLAVVPFSYSGLIAIADQKGFFREVGLDVSLKEYPSGFAAVEAMCRGEAEIATGADIVFAAKVLDDPSLRAVASIGLSKANEIVARRDRNISKPQDLKGKKVGVSFNTSSEFYLPAFLLANSMQDSEVITVNIPPAEIANALVKGDVDAISSWDINVYQAKKALGEGAISWPAQNGIDWYWLLVTRENLASSPQVKNFLKALIKARNFFRVNEEDGKAILIKRWGFDPDFIREVWDKTRLGVSLSQSMLVSIENFGRWKLRKENNPSALPNYLDFIYPDALDEIDARAVTIFR